MANQAIALQARAPQSNPLGGAIQQGAQMINMMSQQRAAERQNAIAQQQMEIARAGEARAAAKEGRDIGEFELKQIKDVAAYFRDALASWAQPGDVASTQALRDDVIRMVPAWDKIIPSAEVLANDPKARQLAEMRAQEIVNYKYTKPVASVQIGKNAAGEDVLLDTRIGGTEAPAALEIPQYGMQAPGGAAPTAFENAFPTTATPATDAQIEEAAQKIIRGAGVGELGIGAEDFDRASARANQLSAGGGRMQPISMMTGPQMGGGQPDLAAVVQDMMQTKQVTESNRRMMLDVLPPESAAQFDQILKAQNIRTVPDAEPSMRSAVFRPGEDAMPQMQQVQAIPPGYQPTGRAAGAVARPAQVPGSAQVPLTRVRQQAQAERETAEEVYAKELARERAKRDAAAQAGPKPLTPVQEAKLRDNIAKDFKSAQSTLDMMLAPDTGVVAAVDAVRKLSAEQKEAVTGFSAYAPSVFPSSRSADTALKNLNGKVTQMGKSAASLGGAIGQMAVQEWKIVSDMIAGLDFAGMEPADLDNQLDIIEATARRAAQTTRDAFENQYAEEFARYPGRFDLKEPRKISVTQGRKTEAALPRVRTDAEYARLKSGAIFIDPNGQRRRKP